ncbi:MAG: transcription termination factor NusA, partial [Planctomycetota bacterium]|nr:transcription termination factor NusA [Planctomycetota bacterium]
EVAEGIIEIKALAREAGYRTKVAVNSLDPKVDAVGACVGVRGSRIRSIVDELGGEKIDIVRWNDSSKILIANSLKPAEVAEIALCFELSRGTVVVTDDQLSLAIGKRGQNVRLAARLTGWDIDILTPEEFNLGLDTLEKTLRTVEGVESTVVDQVIAMGMVSVMRAALDRTEARRRPRPADHRAVLGRGPPRGRASAGQEGRRRGRCCRRARRSGRARGARRSRRARRTRRTRPAPGGAGRTDWIQRLIPSRDC